MKNIKKVFYNVREKKAFVKDGSDCNKVFALFVTEVTLVSFCFRSYDLLIQRTVMFSIGIVEKVRSMQ